MKRTLSDLGYAIAALPMGAGGRRRLARRLGITPRRRVPLPVVPAFVAFVAAVMVLFLTWSGWLYPLRPDVIGALGHPFTADPLLAGAWGGPTLVGACVVHAGCSTGGGRSRRGRSSWPRSSAPRWSRCPCRRRSRGRGP